MICGPNCALDRRGKRRQEEDGLRGERREKGMRREDLSGVVQADSPILGVFRHIGNSIIGAGIIGAHTIAPFLF